MDNEIIILKDIIVEKIVDMFLLKLKLKYRWLLKKRDVMTKKMIFKESSIYTKRLFDDEDDDES